MVRRRSDRLPEMTLYSLVSASARARMRPRSASSSATWARCEYHEYQTKEENRNTTGSMVMTIMRVPMLQPCQKRGEKRGEKRSLFTGSPADGAPARARRR